VWSGVGTLAVALGDSLCGILSSAIPCQPRPKRVRESRVGGGFPLGRYIGPYGCAVPVHDTPGISLKFIIGPTLVCLQQSIHPFVGPYSSKRG